VLLLALQRSIVPAYNKATISLFSINIEENVTKVCGI
jgi:hypothetical protein